jgi:hypothetical protein
MASASGNLKLIHERVERILKSDKVLDSTQLDELDHLGRLALNMDDVKYRRFHTTGAEAKSTERKAKKAKKK